MRDILFRAKSADKFDEGKWLNGSYVYFNSTHRIYNNKFPSEGWDWCFINPDTVGQYIGRLDMGKNKIFEDDILYAMMPYDTEIGKVIWNIEAAGFYLETAGGLIDFDDLKSGDIAVIGNIHDNPKLLEEE